jgi:hypothetical protein
VCGDVAVYISGSLVGVWVALFGSREKKAEKSKNIYIYVFSQTQYFINEPTGN